jgi:radical SAM superfamily enzyme YgiQ (UPF0313 family)
MARRVLLIAPYIHDFAAYDLWLKPIGLLYVAAAAERAGHEVRIINCLDRLHPSARSSPTRNQSTSTGDGRGKFSFEVVPKPAPLERIPRRYRRYGIPLDAFRQELLAGPRPDVIGVGSIMTYWCGGVAETIAVTREVFPRVPIVLGGIYATLCPEHARAYSGADIVIEGPGAGKFLEFLGDISAPGGADGIDLHALRPAYHLMKNVDSVSMLTSFGCPFSCAYCASKLLQRTFYQRPPQEVVDEISYYAKEMTVRDIALYDDALLVNRDTHVKPILRAVAALDKRVRFHTPNGLHANMVDEEVASLMRAAGFATVRLSVESVRESRLRDSCMKVTPRGFETAASHLFSAGYAPGEVGAYILMGAPGQPFDEVEQTIRFVHAAGVVVKLADFSPIPGTAYFDAAVKTYGIDPSEPLRQNSSVLPHLVPGLLEHYRDLKALATSLNATLKPRGDVVRV